MSERPEATDGGDAPHFPPDDLRVDFGVKALADPKRLADFARHEEERRERLRQERAERARRDALAAFSPVVVSDAAYLCPACSALVADPSQHLDWHGALAATAARASRADMWTRPIG